MDLLGSEELARSLERHFDVEKVGDRISSFDIKKVYWIAKRRIQYRIMGFDDDARDNDFASLISQLPNVNTVNINDIKA